MFNRFRHSLQFEYWPVTLVYIPTLFYWAYLAIRARALFYMTAANPGIELGGFFGESKYGILEKVPDIYKPATIKIDPIQASWLDKHRLYGPKYPLVAKPDVGERGNGVEVMYNEKELITFMSDKAESYLLQAFTDYPIEYGVLFYRMPGEEIGRVISITGKKFMAVSGDGIKSVRELMQENYRYSLQIERLESKMNLNQVPAFGDTLQLEPIGNHCRGTEFTNENHLINMAVHENFSKIARKMDGFYFGRFDLKAKSSEDLATGAHLHIMEVNGTTSEAGHIYSRNYGVIRAYRDIFNCMNIICRIGMSNHKLGIQDTSFKVFTGTVLRHFFGKKARKNPALKQSQWA